MSFPFCINCKKEKKNTKYKRCISCAQKERFKNGAWNKGIKRYWNSSTQWKKGEPRISGENAYQWKGERVSYVGLHQWLKKYKEDSGKCSFCGSNKTLQWANISHLYKRELNDYMRLCYSCHRNYDFIYRKFSKYIYLSII